MTKTASLHLPAVKNEDSKITKAAVDDLAAAASSVPILTQPAATKSHLNKLELDGVNLSFDNSNVDMSLLSTVHVCAAQVRRYKQKYAALINQTLSISHNILWFVRFFCLVYSLVGCSSIKQNFLPWKVARWNYSIHSLHSTAPRRVPHAQWSGRQNNPSNKERVA